MTLDELVEEIEKLFDCRYGDYRSYHTVRSSSVDPLLSEIYPYVTLGFIGIAKPNHPLEVTFEDLRAALLEQFKELRLEYGPILYWRFAKERRIQEEINGDKGPDREGDIKIRTRVAIPRLDHRLFTLEDKSYPRVEHHAIIVP